MEQAAVEIEGQLRLNNLGEDLSTLGRFVRIAHFGVIGHPDLQIKVRTSLRSVFELCHETAHTLHDFERTSQEALESLQTAYRYLGEALEEQALKILISLQEMSKEMKTQAGNLSKKCSEQSQFIKEVGDTTLIKRGEVKKEHEDTKGKIETLKVEEVEADEDIKEAETTKQEAQTDLQSTYSKKEEAMNELISANEDNQKKNQEFMAEMHKKREALTSEYKKEIAKVDGDYTSSKSENEKIYLEQIKANDDKFRVSSLAIAQEYKAALQKNEDDLPKKLKDNEKWLADKQDEIKKKYRETIDIDCKDSNESIRKIENDYDNKIGKIERALKDELKKNEETLDAQLKQNQEILDLSLSGNEKQCEAAKKKTWFWQSGTRAEQDNSKATKDVNVRTEKAEADKAARDHKINKDDEARTKEYNERRDVYNSKENKLQPHHDKIHRITNEALRNQSKDIAEAITKKDELDLEERKKKEKADINAKDQKDKKILKAEEDRQATNDNALKEKNKSNEEAKSTKENAAKKREENYKDMLQQLDKEEKSFNKNMKITLDSYATKIEDIKEKERRNQKLIDESKKNKKEAQKQMRKVVEQLTQCRNRAEIHKVTEDSLEEAVRALNEIEAIMINVGNFWKEVEGLCEKVTGRTMKTQVEMLSGMEPQKRKEIWQSKAFKIDALNFYGKWIALKRVCASASGNVNSALDEVRRYMVENPKEDEAFQSIQEMAGKFLKELPHEELPQELPHEELPQELSHEELPQELPHEESAS